MESRLERAERQGEADVAADLAEQLSVPPFPQALNYLWQDYSILRGRKANGHHGPNPIEWPDFDAFIRLSGKRLAPWEVSLLIDLDDLYLSEMTRSDQQPDAATVDRASPSDPAGVRRIMKSLGSRPAKPMRTL